MSKIYALLRGKFSWPKTWLWKKNDKYEVCQSLLISAFAILPSFCTSFPFPRWSRLWSVFSLDINLTLFRRTLSSSISLLEIAQCVNSSQSLGLLGRTQSEFPNSFCCFPLTFWLYWSRQPSLFFWICSLDPFYGQKRSKNGPKGLLWP